MAVGVVGSMDRFSDNELLERFRAGDERAFAALHDRHRPALVRHATRITRSPEDAEDAVQEAMVRAHGSLGGERDIRVRAWLFTLVQHSAIDVLRRRRAVADEAVEVAAAGADEVMLRRATLRDAVADLRALPDRQRRAVAMLALEGRTHEEIAAALGTNVQASKSLVKRARDNLAALAEARAMPCPPRSARGAAVRRHRLVCVACRVRAFVLVPLLRLLPANTATVGVAMVAVSAPAVLAGGGAIVSERTVAPGDPAPRSRAGVAAGQPLPKDVAFVEVLVRLPAGVARPGPGRVTLTCPAGMVVDGLSAGGGRPGRAALRRVGLLSTVASGRDTKGVVAFQVRPNLPVPVTLRLGIGCMSPERFRRIDAYGRALECEAMRHAPEHVRQRARCGG